MENDEKKPDETTTVETPADDDKITVEALRELLKESNEAIKGLKDEMSSVKKENAKLLAKIDITDKVNPDTIMNDLFNKYNKH